MSNKNKKKLFTFTIIFILIVLSIGSYLFYEGILADRHVALKVTENPNYDIGEIIVSDISCLSNNNYKEFVYPDFLTCTFHIIYKNSNFRLNYVDLWNENYEYNIKKTEKKTPLDIGETKGTEYLYRLKAVPIKYEGFTDYSLELYFYNNKSRELIKGYFTMDSYDGISSREYHSRRLQLVSLLLSLFIISISVIPSGIKNLRDIFQNK